MPRKRKSDKPTIGPKESSAAAVELLKARRDRKDRKDGDAASSAASTLGKRRMALLTKKEHAAMSRKGGLNYWAAMTEEEKSIEMKRRVAVRARNRRQAMRKRTGLD
jgi:hypothetical protein